MIYQLSRILNIRTLWKFTKNIRGFKKEAQQRLVTALSLRVNSNTNTSSPYKAPTRVEFQKKSTYIPPYFIGIFLLGAISGSTFTLITFTIPYQLAQAKYSTTILGSIFLTTIPYCLKPLWGPFIDKYSIPILCKKFGQRRGWILSIQAFLLIFIATFLIIDPTDNLLVTAVVTFSISLSIAILDSIVDAYRIERTTTEKELSIASTFGVTGFRLGMLISSTGALYISHIVSWYYAYLSVFFLVLLGPIIILFSSEPIKNQHAIKHLISFKKYKEVIKESTLMLKEKNPQLLLIILFIFLYKASDSVPMAMSSPLFLDLSFTSEEIASISKAYGLLMMIIGGIISGFLTSKIGVSHSILICGSLQLLSPLMFAFLSIIGHDIVVFIMATTVQNFCAGLAGTTLIIYFSTLCGNKLVGTQFAIISSIGSLSRIILSSLSGLCATYVPWPQFFLYNSALSLMFIPIFLLIQFNQKRLNSV